MNKNMVWYFSYGSNMFFERFKLYILGGSSPFVGKTYTGCVNKNLPEKVEYLKIPHELYFARSAPFWDDGAIAFIKSKPSQLNFSYGKAYLITKEQFFEIVNQENTQFSSKYSSKSYSESIDFKELKKSKFINIGPKDENIEYGKVIYLGEKDEFPIITFTSKYDFDEDEINPPSHGYLSVIIKGLIDYREFNSSKDIHSYLFSKQGISQYYSSEKLFKLINEIKMKTIYKKVNGTNQVSRKGDFIVQLQEGCIPKNKYVILERKDSKAKIKTRVEFLDKKEIDLENINLDQKIRCAIGVPKGGNVIVTPYSSRENIFQRLYNKTIYFFLIKLFGVQKNIVRVKRASYNDMETDVCRLNIDSMSIIGVEPGDFIVIESISSKLKLRVLETTSRIESEMEKRVHNNEIIDKDCEKLLSIKEIEGNLADLHSIHLDLDARNTLGVNQCEPVFIRRSIIYEIRKKLHQVSTPIVLTIITILFAFQFFTDDLKKLIATILGVIIVSALTLMSIKKL